MAPARHRPVVAPPAATGPPTPSDARRRADAQRSIEAILDAALARLSGGAEVNIVEIARAAGVGRVTLYGHFPTREALVDAVVARAIAQAGQALDAVDLDSGPATAALARLATSSWQILNQHRQLMVAGTRHLGAERMRAHHDQVMDRVRGLVARGQSDGEIRTDLPVDWLITTYYALLHAAADEVNAGRLDPAHAGHVAATTITAALRPPG
jgi:AcrR family transcriptional regulator